MIVYIKGGLIYNLNNSILDVAVADKIASSNKLGYAETFTRIHTGKHLILDENLVIKRELDSFLVQDVVELMKDFGLDPGNDMEDLFVERITTLVNKHEKR